MITPQEQILLDKLKQNPNFNQLCQTLDLITIPSQAFKQSLKIQARISELWNEFEKASNLPYNQRSVIKTYSDPSIPPFGPLRAQEIENYLVAIYGPRPWPTPLPFAPF